MPEQRRHFDDEFRAGAVRIVNETRKSIAEVARDLDIGAETLRNWVRKDRLAHQPGALSETERDELNRLRKDVGELRMERDVLKRSVVLWVKEATR